MGAAAWTPPDDVLTRPAPPPDLVIRYGPGPERVAEANKPGARPLPSLHSDLFYPVPEPTIKTGVLTMSMAVLNLVGK